MEFFRTLDQYANMYMNKYEKVKKGDKYYNDLYQKVSNLLKTGEDWMIKRSEEKNAILSTIKGVGKVKVYISYSESSKTIAMYDEKTVVSSTEEIAVRLNSSLQSSSTLTITVFSLTEDTVPWIPPMVITLSPFFNASSIFCVSFCFLFCGRIKKR